MCKTPSGGYGARDQDIGITTGKNGTFGDPNPKVGIEKWMPFQI